MTERRDQPVTGDVIEGGDVRMHGWEWSEIPGAPSRSRLPWFGIFLVVFGALLLLRQLFPSLETPARCCSSRSASRSSSRG